MPGLLGFPTRPINPVPRWDHPLFSRGRPLIALFPRGRGSTAARDLMGRSWTTNGGVTSVGSPYGAAWKYSLGYHEDTTLVLPTTACTVLLVLTAPSSTTQGAAFGGGHSNERLQCHLPYSGTLYWDFGPNTSPNRLTWTPPAAWFGADQWHAVAFRAGTRGSSIWSDGAMKSSQSTAITRANTLSSPGLTVGKWFDVSGGSNFYGDNAIDSFHLFDRELSDAQIVDWSLDPYAHVRTRRPAFPFFISTAAAGDVTPPTLSALTVPSAGTTLTATLSESGCLPTSGTGGFTLGGTSAVPGVWSISGTTLTILLTGTPYAGETVTLSYTRSATIDDIHDAAGNFLADFSGASVTNGSTQPPPVVAGFFLDSAGAAGFFLDGV